jgi:anti-sigma B factor antagonist
LTTAVGSSFERVSWSITRYGHTRVRVCGELDIRTAAAIEAHVFFEVAHTGDRLVIDLAALTFIDSTGLRMLVKLNHHELERGRPVTIITGDATTRRVLELARVSGIRLLDERG